MENAATANQQIDAEVMQLCQTGGEIPDSYVSAYERSNRKLPTDAVMVSDKGLLAMNDDKIVVDQLSETFSGLNSYRLENKTAYESSLINNCDIQVKIADLGNACYKVRFHYLLI